MKLSRVVLAVFLLVAFAVEAHAQWSAFNNPTAYGTQYEYDLGLPGVAEDGSNGSVVVWSNNTTHLVYAIHYNQSGQVSWGPVQVGTIDAITGNPVRVVRSGSYWFVAWFDPDVVNSVNNYKIWIKKLNSSGSVVASTSVALGAPYVDSVVDVLDLFLVARTNGGIALGWRKQFTCNPTCIIAYARLYSSDLSSNIDLPYVDYYSIGVTLFRLLADNSDGVYVIWGCGNIYPYPFKAQRYNASGNAVWNDFVDVVKSSGAPVDADVALDGSNGFVAAVECLLNLTYRVRVQRVAASDGTTSWNEFGYAGYGQPVSTLTTDQHRPQIIVNNSHTAAITSWINEDEDEIWAQRDTLSSSFARSWDSAEGAVGTGLRINVDDYWWIAQHRMASNIDDQTVVVWSYQNQAVTESGIRSQMLGDDGDIEVDAADVADVSIGSTSDTIELPAIVPQPIGAVVPYIGYPGDTPILFTHCVLPPFSYDIEGAYNELHCTTMISWRTWTGTTQNKLKYRALGSSTWSSKNANGSGSMWSASISATNLMEYKTVATIPTVPSFTLESAVLQTYSHCGPDPTSPMQPERKPVAEVFLNAHPNPFNPQVTVDYGVVALSRVELAIYDASGSLIKTLVSGTKAAGTYSETWNGTSNSGDRVASGVYFSRLIVNGQSLTQKLVMLK